MRDAAKLKTEPTAYDQWLSQALRGLFDSVLHERLPAGLLALLPRERDQR